MSESVTIDEKGRLVIPRDARRRAGLKAGSRLLVDVRGPGIIELRDYETLSRAVKKIAAEKLSGWREEAHKEDKLLLKLQGEEKDANH